MLAAMDCSWFCVSILGLFVVYKLLDRILRIPYIGRYADRCILVTGCDTGFGNALVKRLDSLGCHVFAGCLTEKGETELRKSCSDRVLTIPLDVAEPDSVRKALQFVKDTLASNGTNLWAVVNNAAILGPVSPIEWLKIDDYRRLCDVNLHGTTDVTMSFLPLLKRSRGRVVNMSSSNGRLALPTTTAYCVTKYGVEAFSDGLRRSLLPYGCRVAIVEPGLFKTNFVSLQVLLAQLKQAWDSASPEIKEEFGEEFYKEWRCNWENPSKPTFASTDLSPVVDSYVHAVLGRYPRARYNPGWDSVLFVVLSWLPEWLSDRLLQVVVPPSSGPAILKKKLK